MGHIATNHSSSEHFNNKIATDMLMHLTVIFIHFNITSQYYMPTTGLWVRLTFDILACHVSFFFLFLKMKNKMANSNICKN